MSTSSFAPATTLASCRAGFFTPLTGGLVALALFFAVVLRLDSFRDDLWIDELHTAWVVAGTWGELLERAAIGNQPPLYFAAVKVVTQAVGLSAYSLRLLSIMAGLGLVLLSGRFAWLATGNRWCALLALWHVAIDPTCIYYSTEARSYGLLQLTLAALFLSMLEGGNSRWELVGRGFLAAVAIHLQFTSLIFLAPLYAARLIVPLVGTQTDRSPRLRAVTVEIILVGVLAAPLLTQVGEIASRSGAWQTFVPKPSWQGLAQLFPWTPAIVGLIGAGIVTLFAPDKDSLQAAQAPPRMGWLSWLALGPAALALMLALFDVAPLFYRRYLLGSLWPVLMLPVVSISLVRGRWRAGLLVLVAFFMVWQSGLVAPEIWKSGRLTASRSEEWGAATQLLGRLDPRGEHPLFVASGLIESRRLREDPSPLLRDYCKLPIATLYRAPQSAGKIEPISSVVPYDPPVAWVDRVIEQEGGLWLLRVRQGGEAAWRRFADRLLRSLDARSAQRRWSANFHVFSGVVVLEIQPVAISSE